MVLLGSLKISKMGEPDSKKSNIPLISLSAISTYPILEETFPLESISGIPLPIIPSKSGSMYPASLASKQPSPSLSLSREFGIPSLSKSSRPSLISSIPSLSSSKS